MLEAAFAVHVLATVTIVASFAYLRPFNVLSPVAFYLAFHAIAFVLRPFLVIFLGHDVGFRISLLTPSDADLLTGLIVADLSLAVFLTGVSLVRSPRVPLAAMWPPPLDFSRQLALTIAVMALLPLALYSATLVAPGTNLVAGDRFLRDTGGAVTLRLDSVTGGMVYEGASAYVVMAHNFLAPLCILLIAACRFRWWSFIPFGLAVAFRMYLGWDRWGIVLPGLTVVLLLLTRTRGRPVRAHHLLLVAGLAVVFYLLGSDRDLIKRLLGLPVFFESARDYDKWLGGLDTLDIASFEFLIYIVQHVPASSGTFSYFTQHLDIFTAPVPRMFWPEKPIGSPINFFTLNEFGNFAGLTRGLSGDGWMSLGWLGVAINCGLVGYGMARLHRYFLVNRHRPAVFYGYIMMLPVSVQFLRDGSLSALMLFTFWLMTPYLLMEVIAAVLRWGRSHVVPATGPPRARPAA
jgi:hypothetical protein